MQKILVIMAGGQSSRMKQDKALLPFGGFESLAEYQYQRLLLHFDKIYISAKNNKFNFPVDIIEDRYEGSSPLVGLISIFETIEASEVFVLSVDAPFVSIESIKKLYKHSHKKCDVIVATSNNGVEPLCAIYRNSFLKTAKELLTNNHHRLQGLLNELQTVTVKIEEKREFMNLNYPREYEEAKDLL